MCQMWDFILCIKVGKEKSISLLGISEVVGGTEGSHFLTLGLCLNLVK